LRRHGHNAWLDNTSTKFWLGDTTCAQVALGEFANPSRVNRHTGSKQVALYVPALKTLVLEIQTLREDASP
jgi:hypothetical protein